MPRRRRPPAPAYARYRCRCDRANSLPASPNPGSPIMLDIGAGIALPGGRTALVNVFRVLVRPGHAERTRHLGMDRNLQPLEMIELLDRRKRLVDAEPPHQPLHQHR